MNINQSDGQTMYMSVVTEYEKIIEPFTYKCFDIGCHEKAYLIEDSFILYLGLINYSSSEQFPMYCAVFEEFSYNEIHKFNISAFCRKFEFGFVQYKKFNGSLGMPLRALTEWNGRIHETTSIIVPSQLEKMCAKLPELKIKERNDNWKGFLYYFIVYELIDGDKTGYAICNTTTSNVHTVAQRKGNDVEMSAIMYYPYHLKSGLFVEGQGGYNGVRCDTTMMELLTKRIEKNKAEGWKNKKRTDTYKACLAEKELKYFILPTYVKEKTYIYQNELKLLADAKNGVFAYVERHEYLIPENKWKSEQLVFELTRKLFKKRTVLHQHRPFFLRSSKGQLSYDIFVCGENIAIEYQGKQHFEPIEIFGGKEHFESQKERDNLKAQLSRENGVKLIYVNYWEDISIDLLKEKINEVQ